MSRRLWLAGIRLRVGLCLCGGLCLAAAPGEAGVLAAGSLGWGVFALRPQASETSANFFAISPEVQVGYSADQVLDVNLFASHFPGHRGGPSLKRMEASYFTYGGEIGLRLAESVHLSVRGGLGEIRGYGTEPATEDVRGKWAGPAGGICFGTIFKLGKKNFLEIGLGFSHAQVDRQLPKSGAGEKAPSRKVDSLRISFTYTFNGVGPSLLQNTFFQNTFL